jgi:hypothetical protein
MYGRNSLVRASNDSAPIFHHSLNNYLIVQDHDRTYILSKVFHETQPYIGYSIAVKQSTNVDPSSSLSNEVARLQYDGRASFLSAGGEN